MLSDSRYKPYTRKGVSWMRSHEVGEDMTGISVSEADKNLIDQPGGMIAVNPLDETDRWYVAQAWFEAQFEAAS
jgi:hypothetical protein